MFLSIEMNLSSAASRVRSIRPVKPKLHLLRFVVSLLYNYYCTTNPQQIKQIKQMELGPKLHLAHAINWRHVQRRTSHLHHRIICIKKLRRGFASRACSWLIFPRPRTLGGSKKRPATRCSAPGKSGVATALGTELLLLLFQRASRSRIS